MHFREMRSTSSRVNGKLQFLHMWIHIHLFVHVFDGEKNTTVHNTMIQTALDGMFQSLHSTIPLTAFSSGTSGLNYPALSPRGLFHWLPGPVGHWEPGTEKCPFAQPLTCKSCVCLSGHDQAGRPKQEILLFELQKEQGASPTGRLRHLKKLHSSLSP